MASKKKRGGRDDFNWDDDLDFNIPDFGGDNPEAVKKDRKPIATGMKSAASGFGKTFVSEGRLRKTLTKSLPKEYEEPISKAFEIKDRFRDLYNTSSTQANEIVRETKRTVGRIARNLDSALPKKLAEKLKAIGDSADSDTVGTQSKSEIEQGTIDSAFASIFAQTQQAQADNQKKADARQVIQDQIDQKRHKDMTTILGSIDNSLLQLSTFQDKIGTNYMKKSLELQFRSYFLQNDMLQLQSKYFEQFKTDLQAITKNTGLPDYVKKAPKEALMEHIRDKAFDSLANSISKKRNQWVSGVFKKAQGKIGDTLGNIREGLGTILDAAEQGSSMYGSGFGPTGAELAGDLIGGFAGNKAQDYLAKKIRAQMLKNPKVVQKGNRLAQIFGSLPQFVGNELDNGKYADKIPEWLKDILRPEGESSTIRTNNEVDLERASRWSDKNSRSLNIVIPELLSKIHHELYVSRTGDLKSSPLAYDYEKGKFVSQKDRQSQLANTLVSGRTKETTKHQIDSIFKEIDPEGKIDANARQAIAEGIYGANKRNIYFNRENMLSHGVIGDHPEARKKFEEYLDKDSSGGNERRLAKMFGHVGAYNGEVKDVVQALIDQGRHGELADMGILDLKNGRINLDMIRRMELGGGWRQAANESGVTPQLTASLANSLPANSVHARAIKGLLGGRNKKRALDLWNDRESAKALAGDKMVPGNAQDIQEVSKMFREVVASLNKVAKSGELGTGAIKGIEKAIESASGKTELAEIRDILKRIEEKGIVGVNMTPEMLEQYFKGKLDNVTGYFGKGGQALKSGLGKAGKFLLNGAKGSYNRATGIAKKAWNWATTGPSVFDWLGEQRDKFDLFIGNEVEPRLSKVKLEAGRYVDAASGEVIKKFEDIKGAVKDIDTGEIVLKASEVKDAILKNFETGKSVLLRLTGWGKKSIKAAAESIKKFADRVTNFSKSAYGVAWAGLKKAYEHFTDGPQDVYLKNNYETPVLLKRVMAQGLYFDKVTLDPISKVSQIKGPVVDNEENVLITKEDLANGLYDKNGQEIKTGFDKIAQYVGNSVRNTIGMYKKILGKGKDLGVRAMSWLKSLFGFDSPFTVFSSRTNDILTAMYAMLNDRLPGDRSPDLESMIGKAGTSSTGQTVKQAGKAAGALKEGFMKRWKRGREQAQGKLDELKERLPGDIDNAKRMGSQAYQHAKDRANEWKDEHWDKAERDVRERLGRGRDRVVDGLHAVVDTLRDRLPEHKSKVFGDKDGDGIRDGSIDDIRKKRAAEKAEEDKVKKEQVETAEKGSEKGAFSALINFFKNRKGNEEEGEHDHSLIGDIVDDVTGGGGGGGKGKKPRGRFGKGWDKLKGKLTPKGKGLGSRLLRGAGKTILGAGKLGLKGAGLLLGGGLFSAETLLGGLSLVGSALGMAGTALGAIISSPVTVPLLIAAGVGAAGYFAYKWLTKPDPQAIEKVRLVQYGFKPNDIEAYKKMKSTEQLVKDAVVFKGEKAEFDPKKVNLQEAMKLYGLNPTDPDHAKKFIDWFANRFRPVYLQHCALIKTSKSPKPLEDVDSNKPDFKKSYLDQCLFPGAHYAVVTNPFKDQAYLYTSQYTVEKQIKTAQEEVAKEGTKKEEKTRPDAPAGSAVAAAMAKNEAAKKALEKEQQKDKTSTAGIPQKDPRHDPDKVSAFKRLIAATTGANARPGGPGRAPGDPISGPAGPKGESSQGNAKFDAGGLNVKQPGNGTGGDINAVPIPKGNGNWAALKDTIVTASKMAGVDPKLSAAITAVESGFDYKARPIDRKTGRLFSSAKGLNQFIDGTWNTMMSKYAKKYGIDPSTSAMDPRANALMGAEFIKENMAGLKTAVKRDLTATDVYIAHFMGLGGARKFLTADPNTSGASLFPDAAKANPWIYFKDPQTMSQPKTLAEIYGDFTKKLSKKLTAAGYSDSDVAGIGADPAKVKADNDKLQASQSSGPGGVIVPGAPVASPKPTTPNSITNNPNAGPVPSTYQQAPKAASTATIVDSPRPAFDPSAGGSAPAMSMSPAPSQSSYVRQNNQLNTGDSLDIMKQGLKETQTQTGLLQRIADGIDKLNTRFDKNMGDTQAATPAPAPTEKNNYGKTASPMTAPSIGFRRQLAGT